MHIILHYSNGCYLKSRFSLHAESDANKMGLDGGTIPVRCELVQMKKKPEKKDKESDTHHKWNNCMITQLPLQLPVLTCHLGSLYNKQSVLEFLLGKICIKDKAVFSHIESKTDVRELNLSASHLLSDGTIKYCCPVTGLDMNGIHRFVCLWSCGCVLSEKAIREIPSSSCLSCGRPCTKSDVVVLNPSTEDLVSMKENMQKRRSAKDTSASSVDICLKTQSKAESVYRENSSSTDDLSSSSRKRSRADATKSDSKAFKEERDHKHKKQKREKKKKDKHKSEKIKKGRHSKDKKGKHKTPDPSHKPALHPGWHKFLANL